MKRYFVWLGSGRAAKVNVGNKGALLDQAAKSNLPVPEGAVLLHEFFESLLEEQILLQENGRFHCPNPIELYESLFTAARMPRFDHPIAVRSAFSAEDREDESLAGHFDSVLNVDSSSPEALSKALCQVWNSASRHKSDFRKDVLLLTMVKAQQAGVAFSEAAYQDDLINYTDGLADKLVSGTVAGQTLLTPQLTLGESATDDLPEFGQRVQKLLRGVRRTFGVGDWDIEWADDGQICWLIQLRPITRASRRNEAFTFANLREILPDPPSPFMTSIVESGSTELFDYYRQFDPSLPTNRHMVRVFEGRPFFNITLLTDMMRKWGLPTALVTSNLGGSSDRAAGFKLGRFLWHTPILLKLGWAQITAVSSAEKATQKILAEAKQPYLSLTDLSQAFSHLFVQFVSEMLNLTQAMSGPLLILRTMNTLAEHNRRQSSIATQSLIDLAPLQTAVSKNPSWQEAIKQNQLPTDSEFQTLWATYLDKHGHRGIYESDISRPRYHEDPSPLIASLTRPPLTEPEKRPYSLKAQLTRPIWWHCGRILRARELWRYHAIQCYDLLRQQFLPLIDQAVQDGLLPNQDAFWYLTLEEVAQLDNGKTFTKTEIDSKKANYSQLQTYDFPDLIHQFDDFSTYLEGYANGSIQNLGRLSGIGLTDGEVNGRVWLLREPSTQLPDGFIPEETILVARAIDPGWISTFTNVAGVVVEIGGDLSHGSIILREIGLPAVTNVAKATQQLKTGDPITLNATNGIVIKN